MTNAIRVVWVESQNRTLYVKYRIKRNSFKIQTLFKMLILKYVCVYIYMYVQNLKCSYLLKLLNVLFNLYDPHPLKMFIDKSS